MSYWGTDPPFFAKMLKKNVFIFPYVQFTTILNWYQVLKINNQSIPCLFLLSTRSPSENICFYLGAPKREVNVQNACASNRESVNFYCDVMSFICPRWDLFFGNIIISFSWNDFYYFAGSSRSRGRHVVSQCVGNNRGEY